MNTPGAFHLLLLAGAISLCTGCGCEPDINLGKFDLAETSRQFIPYSGTETLVFEDQDGITHRLTSQKGRDLRETRMVVGTLCDEGLFDQQHQYYEIQREELLYADSLGKQGLYLNLMTQFEDASLLDSMAIYDFLLVDVSVAGSFYGRVEILTAERQNRVSDLYKSEFWNVSTFVGDTTLYGKAFEGVYESAGAEGRRLYYSAAKGLLALKISDQAHWVLKE